MKKAIHLYIILILLSSCATKYDPNSKKAVYNNMTGEIIWNKEKHNMSFFDQQYDADKVFLDDKKTQNLIKESNMMSKKANTYLWGGLGLAILYLLNSKNHSESTRNTIYYGIFTGVGLVPSIYIQTNRESKIKEGIKDYNQRKGYSFNSNSIPLGVKYSFKF
ncbi:MAG: hypothetical protein N4A33_10610 [Bacteriovoracaceae bacterium]|jgi:hypothetical protein|nr:hypothetical protein [Bacteriovoracaceae bacterium]